MPKLIPLQNGGFMYVETDEEKTKRENKEKIKKNMQDLKASETGDTVKSLKKRVEYLETMLEQILDGLS